MKILKTNQQMYSHRSLPVFTVFMVIFVWMHYNYGDLIVKVEQPMKKEKKWIKESTWISLTKLYHYYLSEDIKILCMHYQKRSQQFTEKTHF